MKPNHVNSYFRRQFWLSIIGHILYGFVFEKSKLYFPYKFGRNILLLETDVFKFYLSITVILTTLMFIIGKLLPNWFASIRIVAQERYRGRSLIHFQLGGFFLGISMMFTGFCPAHLPIYLGISPALFFYGVATSYAAYVIYYIFGPVFLRTKIVLLPPSVAAAMTTTTTTTTTTIDSNEAVNSTNISSIDLSSNKEKPMLVVYVIIFSFCTIILLTLEMCQQSISQGHSSTELLDLLSTGDYLSPGPSGTLCGIIQYFLYFICHDYRILTSEWLLNIFYYTAELGPNKIPVSGRLCIELTLKVIAMAMGVRLSLWTSRRQEVPTIDYLAYALVGCGSFIGAFGVCLTTAAFSDHLNFACIFLHETAVETIMVAIAAGWMLLSVFQFIGISNLK